MQKYAFLNKLYCFGHARPRLFAPLQHGARNLEWPIHYNPSLHESLTYPVRALTGDLVARYTVVFSLKL